MAIPDPQRIDLSALDRLRARLMMIVDPDAGPLMVSWMKIIVEDNRRGVLAGTDKDGVAMVPVKYRPVGAPRRPTKEQRNAANLRARQGHYGGFGPSAAGLHNNLTSAEYRRLGGPPLAPRGSASRVITNLKTGYQRPAKGVWEAFGYWDEVVSTRGVPFLGFHFDGAGKLPRRDLRGVRPEGMRLAAIAANNWGNDLIRAMG
jgi:hypothetical protein